MTAIITWAEGVISLAEPPIVSECSVSGSEVGSGLLLFGSEQPFQEDVRWDRVALSADTGEDIRRLIVFPSHMVEFKPLEPN